MARLPSNTFMFNYNAKQYDSSTKTFPKTTGQLFDQDVVLNNAITVGDDYVYFNQNSWMVKTYSNANDNPFNVTSSNPYFTFIYKTSGWTTDDTNLIANRGDNFNFMMRANRCIFGTEYCKYSPTSNPQIVVIRANTNAVFSRQEWDSEGNVLSAATATGYYGNTSNAMDFFCGMSNGYENFRKTFYWMYLSREYLTDEQILQVIKYNEGNLIQFGLDVEELSFNANSGSSVVTLDSESAWTATTNESWITLSQYSGETGGTITVSVSANEYLRVPRIGTVEFTDGESIATLTITQSGNTIAILKNLYRSGNKVRQMFRNGTKIYQLLERFFFSVDTDSITFEQTGGTYVINLTASDNWTMTIPDWLTATSLSGVGSASITISTTGSTEVNLDGTIVISSEGRTHSITVKQSVVEYVSCIYKPVAVANTPNYMIDTNLNATTDTVMRILYIGRGVQQGDAFIGYEPGMPNCSSDSADYRFFSHSSGGYVCLDFNQLRQETTARGTYRDNNVEYDVSVHNNYLVDNKTDTIFNSGTTQSSIASPLATIHIDTSTIKVKEVQIWRGDNIVFNGKAAVYEGQGCLFDEVTQTYFTNNDFEITYDE